MMERKQKGFIKGAFSQYLSPTVIDQIVENPEMLQLGGEKREMTPFFSDIQGFSTRSEISSAVGGLSNFEYLRNIAIHFIMY